MDSIVEYLTSCRLRDQMGLISSAPEINTLAAKADTTGGLYFVTAFNGLLAPYWDPSAGGLLIGASHSTLSLCLVVQYPIAPFRPKSIHNACAHCPGDA